MVSEIRSGLPERPPVFFYSSFPLGFHNVEAERKALAFADAGYEVLYATAPLIRNPRPADLGRLRRVAARRLGGAGRLGTSPPSPLQSTTLRLLPPRQFAAVRRLNGRWIARQVRGRLSRDQRPVAWLRWPTPEVIDALIHLQPAVTIYEVVDSYWETPGIVGRWRSVYERAERALLARADLVVASGEVIASRFRELGCAVRLLPHGVDLPGSVAPGRPAGPTTLGFVGTLDYRLDIPVIRALAESHPEWRVRLAGPITEGFDRQSLADLPNVSVEPPVPYPLLEERLSEFDVGLMPYFDHAHYLHMSPVKNLELLAAGKPAVARPSPALEPFGDLLYFARTPEEFVRQTEWALAEDSAERFEQRRAVAAEHTWDRRHQEMLSLVDEALAGDARRAHD